jgi:hypothetical protein
MKALALLLVFVTGCTLLETPQAVAPQKRLSTERIQQARRITLEYGIGGLWQTYSESWALERSGPCAGEITHGRETPSGNVVTKQTYELSAETFLEAQRVLLESKFRTLKPGFHGFRFETSASLSVDCDGVTHSVSWDQSRILENDPLLTFVCSLRQRAKLISPQPETSSP